MTEKNSSTGTSEAAASAVDPQEGIGTFPAGVDPVGVASLSFNASVADPAVARELVDFCTSNEN